MASTSASSVQKSFKYDVFLSFRGEDTRRNFVDNLYHALKQNGIYTYKDDQEIKKGKRISDELISSIQDSKFYIIVFSKNYASSSWCLNELVEIMKCQRTKDHTAYPLFYDVEPTEIRNQSGVVQEAFSKHVNDEGEERWRDALKEAAGLAGWELKNTFDGHEAQLIQKVVEEISQELRFINSSIDEKLIGMETRVKDVVSSLEIDIYDVRMIGIKGMGGAGKTTLARVVFDQISFRFEGSSFVENVKENSKNPSCGLKSLQKQVLSDVLKAKDVTVNGVYEGKKLMKQRMCCIKVLVILDDVDHIDQLEALVGELSWFKPGSRFIITTREEQVLVAHGVPRNMILDVNMLSYEEANCLFNRYAFGREVPKQSYKELSRQVVRYAAGLPLTIKVLGSFLRGKDELEWTDALERLKTIPLKETQEILEISYNGLEEDYKEIFLDVACILKGWKKTKAIIALESCGLHGTSGLRVLEQKSLITITDNGILGMHDHIEEMGKNIVRRLYPNLPYRHSRLWIGEEIEGVLVEDRGAEATRCIILKSLHPEFIMKGLRNMNELIFLVVTGVSTIRDLFNNNTLRVNCYNLAEDDVEEDGIDLPDSLRYICWNNYPYTCLPKTFIGNNLVGLEMHSSNLRQLWKSAVKKVPKLKFIDLTNCELKTFDIGLTKNLERLQLNYCSHLVELRMPIGSYKLKSLSIGCCKLITTLDLVGVQNLETLKVRGCHNLVELRMPAESFKVRSISIALCKLISTLDLGQAQNLETLEVRGCDDLVELRMPVRAKNLEKLEVSACHDLVELRMPFESFKLKSFSIAHCKLITTLDLMRAQNFESLEIRECDNLVELRMPTESFKLKSLSIACCRLINILALVWAKNLETIEVRECDDLVELRMPIESSELKSLSISIVCCRLISTLDLVRAKNLETIEVRECDDLVELRMPIESFKLKSISIAFCKLIRTLDLVWAQNLETIEAIECDALVDLRMPTECFKLKSMCIAVCKLISTLDLGQAQNLETLEVSACHDLVKFHMPIKSFKLKSLGIAFCNLIGTLDLVRVQNLETLEVKKCDDLVKLRMPTECLKLKSFSISCCKLINTLDLSRAQSLKALKVRECDDLVELRMPFESFKLKSLSIDCCKLISTLDLVRAQNLETLEVRECDNLVELNMPVENPKLIDLHLQDCCKLKTLNLTRTWNLKKLHLVECGDLLELRMPIESHELKTISIGGSKLRTLYLGLSPYLEHLYLHNCYNLVEIHARVGCLSGSVVLKPCLVSQGFPSDGPLAELHIFARSLGICPLHPDNNMPKFHFECIYKDLLLSSAQNPAKLISFSPCACKNLASLSGIICGVQLRKLTLEGSIPEVPKELDQLKCLEELSLLSTKIEHFPDSICMLKHLKFLRLKCCCFLKKLPEDIGRLESLEELHLTDCTSLRDIPNSICEMKHLSCLHLTNCILLEKLPKEIGRLQCLKELKIKGTSITDLPSSIDQLKDLVFKF